MSNLERCSTWNGNGWYRPLFHVEQIPCPVRKGGLEVLAKLIFYVVKSSQSWYL
ncbi:MAG: hypothetical protein RIS36_1833 [Pseudomonadota bacterium]|jgi:hypothetical protein